MVKQLWLNLPVKDIALSRDFFTKIGFSFNDTHGVTADSACMVVGERPFVIMLFVEELFAGFTRHPVSNTLTASEMLISIDAQSKQEVDELAAKVAAAGGHVFGEPSAVQGWMYGCGFADPDGHRWNVLYMDPAGPPAQ